MRVSLADASSRALAGLGLAIGLLVGGGLGSACFIEAAPSSTFRFTCDGDDDCASNERCADNLCQQPCGAADDEECPGNAPVCLNGFCSSTCAVGEEGLCPSPQSCVGLEFTDPGGPSGETGDAGEDDDEADEDEEDAIGLCTVACDDANPCSDDAMCLIGLCVSLCQSPADCPDGQQCAQIEGAPVSVCLPSVPSGGGGFF